MFMKSKLGTLPINYVVGVSYPRSGHHLMERLLGRYIGPRFSYCPLYTRKKAEREGWLQAKMPKAWDYNCSLGRICPNHGHVHYCKNHEWDGVVHKTPEFRYLVQYRDFLPAVVSLFDLVKHNSGTRDSEAVFRRYSHQKALEYASFMSRWVNAQDDGIEKLVIKYENLANDPEIWLAKALAFFGLEEAIDARRLRKVVSEVPKITVVNKEKVELQSHGIKNSRKVEDFRYYSPEWFAELESVAHAAG